MLVIYALEEHLQAKRELISRALHESMVEVLELPPGKKFQRFISLKPQDFYFAEDRSSEYTVVELNLMQGRSKERIKQLIYSMFDKLEALAGVAKQDLEITVHQQQDYCWGFRGLCGDDAKAQLNYKVDLD